ncbi:DUF2850 domain-containing protein [Vibrio sp. SCSIO 43135]|uniref:DUF2850 domain-containing protein n=1 Tax=Vibrio paucivorans TaxID=2829489 RepID=A0A9X3CDV9_9VIBR|nr:MULTISPECIES: DUF2850 domain-containing protein [Vibrio]MCW8333854.1 DUF2850 domain-containing protein [Vibrio paucivorans]USD44187.1 DUF2850 domain-containing protein [Vibrio sp. SCSIO 43135]
MTRQRAIKTALTVILCIMGFGFASLIYVSYQEYVNPKHVYGDWIEIGAPNYNTEVLTLNEVGFFRNHRLITTHFEFDGKRVHIKTGDGKAVYQIAGTFESPQLKRLVPNSPTQIFIKKGYESTVDMEGGGGVAKNRRAALADHFSGKK